MKKKLPKLNKKGSMLDIFYIIFILFAIILVVFVTKNFFTDFIDSAVSDEGVFEDNNASKDIMDNGTKTLNSFNWMFVLIFILLITVTAIIAYNLNVSGGTIALAIFILIIAVVVAGMLSNFFQDLSDDEEFTNATETYTAPTHMMNNFSKYIFFGGLIIIVVMYLSFKKGSGGYE